MVARPPRASAKELWDENPRLRREIAHPPTAARDLKKSGQHPSGEPAARHVMIDEMRENGYHIEELCEAFEVSKSGYYAARNRPPSQRDQENQMIVSKIKEIHEDRQLQAYGSPRMTAELNEEHGIDPLF